MNLDMTLYLVTEESVPIDSLLKVVEQAIKGGVTIVQLREKSSLGKVFYEKAKAVKELLDSYNVPLIINDRIDIAIAVNAAGVHIGQSDLPLAVVKKIVPKSFIIGVSAGTLEEARNAERNGATYLGVGSVFPTGTKEDAELLPHGVLEEITKTVTIPVVAIGGIAIENVDTLQHTGIAGVAVVSAIMKADSPSLAAKSFLEKLKK
ncbi:thiamine phosphate synthase [Psychrobacillus lasiicapitis]|uniref:thiamine phosphate synthase n=1 Tax=Psychrobacillus lasiicapitis TaxID=1636719 RepID=UPI0019B808FD|nr:thiamine phosphate synthase [Psychrobacillus lasiicapitis]GGA22815.1 thiamine-phosphate synthase [Psychrobacillus lasiicapitis]